MNYGNKIIYIVLLFLSFFIVTACSNSIRNFHLNLYDGYSIKNIDNKIKLYKDDNIVAINNLDYQIKEFKYNSDVICLKLSNDEYYMIYYVDSSIYGPYTKESIEETIKNDATMSFPNDWKNILKAEVTFDE